MQHDDNDKNICTKGDVYEILVPNFPGNKFLRLFVQLSLLQNPLAPQHQMCKSPNPTLLSLVLLPTKLIAPHHPCDSWIDLHGHT